MRWLAYWLEHHPRLRPLVLVLWTLGALASLTSLVLALLP